MSRGRALALTLTVLTLLVPAAAPPASAHDVITTKLTWTREISRLFERRCMSCHQNGGRAPFPLTSYEEARPWAVAIREEVTQRTMPPWNAVRGFGEFRDDPSLTQEEIQLIIDWVNGGAPEGDPRYLTGKLPKAWQDPSAAGFSRQRTGLLGGLRLAGLRPGAELRIVLQDRSGARRPLLWIRSYSAPAGATFLFRSPVAFPPGARLFINPLSAAKVEMLWTPLPRPSTAPNRTSTGE